MSITESAPVYLPQGYPLWVCWLPDPLQLGGTPETDLVIGWERQPDGLVHAIRAQAAHVLNLETHYLVGYGLTEDEARARLNREIDEHRDDLHRDGG